MSSPTSFVCMINVDTSVKEQEILTFLRKFGVVKHLIFLQNLKGEFIGVVYIIYSNDQENEIASVSIHGNSFHDLILYCRVIALTNPLIELILNSGSVILYLPMPYLSDPHIHKSYSLYSDVLHPHIRIEPKCQAHYMYSRSYIPHPRFLN